MEKQETIIKLENNIAQNFYEILGVSSQASAREIKKAYLRLLKENDPNRYPEKKEQFQSIQKAYEILSDPEKRKNYDIDLLGDEDRFTISPVFSTNSVDMRTTSSALILYQGDDFLTTLIKSQPTLDMLIKLAQEDIAIAKLIIKNISRLLNLFFHSRFLIKIVSHYKINGLELIRNEKLISSLSGYDCYQIALISKELCIAVLEIEELAIKFQGEKLLELKKKYGEELYMYVSEKVRMTLEIHEQFLSKDEGDINFDLYSAGNKLSLNQLRVLIEKDIQTATAVIHYIKNNNGYIIFYSTILEKIVSHYQVIGLELIRNQQMTGYLDNFDCYDLSLESKELCKLILETEEISIKFLGRQLFELKRKYGEQIYVNVSEKVCKTLSSYESLFLNGELQINDFDLLVEANLDEYELLQLAKKDLQAANLIINYVRIFFSEYDYVLFLNDLACHYEVIAFENIRTPWLINCYFFDWYKLALSSENVCAAILQTEEIAVRFNGKKLLSLVEKFEKIIVHIIAVPELYERFQAQVLLSSVNNDKRILVKSNAVSLVDKDNARAIELYQMALHFFERHKQKNKSKNVSAIECLIQAAKLGHQNALDNLILIANESNSSEIQLEIARIYSCEGCNHFRILKACEWYRASIKNNELTAAIELLQIVRARYEGNFEEKQKNIIQDIDISFLRDFITRSTGNKKVYFSFLLGLFFQEITLLESASEIFAIGLQEKCLTKKILLSALSLYSGLKSNDLCFIEAHLDLTVAIQNEQTEKLLQTVESHEKISQALKGEPLLKRRLLLGIPFLIMGFIRGESGAESVLKGLLPEALLHCAHIKLIFRIFLRDEISLEEIGYLAQRLEEVISKFPFAAKFFSMLLSKDNLTIELFKKELNQIEIAIKQETQLCAYINHHLRLDSIEQLEEAKQICEFVCASLQQRLKASYRDSYTGLNSLHSITILQQLSSIPEFSAEDLRKIGVHIMNADTQNKLKAISITVCSLAKESVARYNNHQIVVDDLYKLLIFLLPVNIPVDNIRDMVESLSFFMALFTNKDSEAFSKFIVNKITEENISVEILKKVSEEIANRCKVIKNIKDLIDNHFGQLINKMKNRENRLIAKEKVLNFLREKLNNHITTYINSPLHFNEYVGLFENLKQEINKILLGITINCHEDRISEGLSTLFPQFFVTNTKKELEILLEKLDELSREVAEEINANLSNKNLYLS